MSDNSTDELDFEEFIGKTGSIGILLHIDEDDGSLHNELVELVDANKNTITTRLEEASDLGLTETQYEYELPPEERIRITLTRKGRIYRRGLESLDVDELYGEYLQILRELESSEDAIIEWHRELEEARSDTQKPLRRPGEEIPIEEVGFPGDHEYDSARKFLRKSERSVEEIEDDASFVHDQQDQGTDEDDDDSESTD